jgi:hypothetical protein
MAGGRASIPIGRTIRLTNFLTWYRSIFFGSKTIDRVVVYSVQEELNNFGGIDPTDTDNCFVYVLVDFTIEGWNGNNWVTLATVADNDLCKRSVTFAPFSTDQIRISKFSGSMIRLQPNPDGPDLF